MTPKKTLKEIGKERKLLDDNTQKAMKEETYSVTKEYINTMEVFDKYPVNSIESIIEFANEMQFITDYQVFNLLSMHTVKYIPGPGDPNQKFLSKPDVLKAEALYLLNNLAQKNTIISLNKINKVFRAAIELLK